MVTNCNVAYLCQFIVFLGMYKLDWLVLAVLIAEDFLDWIYGW